MMKYIYNKIISLFANHSQEELADFLTDKKNIEKAVEGSMQKRIDLIDRVGIRHKNA